MKSTTLALTTVISLLVAAMAGPSQLGAQDTVPSYSVLYNFTGGADGANPPAGLIRDEAGNLYGTTFAGGLSGCGVVFKLDSSGNETVLYTFTCGADGANSVAGLIRDAAGNLYGTTANGGNTSATNCVPSGCGVVFKLDSSGQETVLYAFSGGGDGGLPQAGLIQDAAGNLYGTTYYGGNTSSSSCFIGGSFGCGVVFKLDPSGQETVLYAFSGGADGANPSAGLIRDAAGNLYSTTQLGGNTSNAICGAAGCGVVFKLDPSGKETVLYTFTGGADGLDPYAGLVRDAAGNLYGTTGYGGNEGSFCYSCGVVFKLDPSGKETVLHAFTGGVDGGFLNAGLVRDGAGLFYGETSFGGGAQNGGVVFKVDASGKETVLHAFSGTDGANPVYGFLLPFESFLYGTTNGGGSHGAGVVFKLRR
jgi:uncharacterized repeat protein (TIGR03803 family)